MSNTAAPNSLYAQAARTISIMSGGKPTDDTRFSIRRVIRLLDGEYSAIIRSNLLNGEQTDGQLYRNFCIPLTAASYTECGCSAPCRVLKAKLPKLASVNGRYMIRYVGTTDMGQAFKTISPQYIGIGNQGRFPAAPNSHSYYLTGDTIFIFPPPESLIDCVLVQALPDSITATVSGCYDIWEDTNIPEWMFSRMRDEVLRKYLILEAQSRQDTTNNASNE